MNFHATLRINIVKKLSVLMLNLPRFYYTTKAKQCQDNFNYGGKKHSQQAHTRSAPFPQTLPLPRFLKGKHGYATQLPIRMQTKIRIQARQRLWDIKYCLVLNYYQKKSAIISGIYRVKRVSQQIPHAQKGIRAQKSSDAFKLGSS